MRSIINLSLFFNILNINKYYNNIKNKDYIMILYIFIYYNLLNNNKIIECLEIYSKGG